MKRLILILAFVIGCGSSQKGTPGGTEHPGDQTGSECVEVTGQDPATCCPDERGVYQPAELCSMPSQLEADCHSRGAIITEHDDDDAHVWCAWSCASGHAAEFYQWDGQTWAPETPYVDVFHPACY